jgi:hypothetical protein
MPYPELNREFILENGFDIVAEQPFIRTLRRVVVIKFESKVKP